MEAGWAWGHSLVATLPLKLEYDFSVSKQMMTLGVYCFQSFSRFSSRRESPCVTASAMMPPN